MRPVVETFYSLPQTAPIVGTLIVKSLERQIVGILIVRFPEHQQRNVNLQRGRSCDSGSITSPMIKSAKSAEREKRIEVVKMAYLSQWGIFLIYKVWFTKSPPFFSSRIFISSSLKGGNLIFLIDN